VEPALDSVEPVTLHDWTPVHVSALTGEIEWALVGAPFAEPFFEQTVDRAMRDPFNLAFSRRTPLATLDALAEGVPELAPAGFIFHMSRCGSTLIAQMLAQLSPAIVLSEPQPLDALLRFRGRGVDDATLCRWLRGMVSALARPQTGGRRLFVKFHAWHVLELPLIRRAFPAVPWVFVFREPRAVLRSHERMPGAEVTAGMIGSPGLGIGTATADAVPAEEHAARVLAAFCEAALAHRDSKVCAFAEYAGLPDTVFSELLPFFGVAPTAEERTRMRAVALRDTKPPNTLSALPAGWPAAWPGIDQAAVRWLDAPYVALRAAAARAR
jgi:hypothetical protein